MTLHQQARRASRARLALSLTALLWARHVGAQVLVGGPAATATARALAVSAASETPAPVSAVSATTTTTTTTTLEVSSPTETPSPPPPPPPQTTTPPTTTPPPSETTTPPSDPESQDGGNGNVPPPTAPPEALSPAAEPGQTRLRAQFRVIGAGASAGAINAAREGGGRTTTEGAFLDALAAASSGPTLPRSSLSVLRVSPAFVPLPSGSSSSSGDESRRSSGRKLLLLDPIENTADILVEVDASSLNAGSSSSANAQAAYSSVRNAAYSGLIQTSLRSTGRRWAVVLTYAAAASPRENGEPLLPLPDDSCEHRFSKSSCLDGTGLTPAAAKGIIALGVLVVLFALAFAGVAWDRRARAEGFGVNGSGSGGGKTGTMVDLAGSPRAAAAAAGLTAIPPLQQQAAPSTPGAALALGEASSSGTVVAGAISSSFSGKIKAER